MSVKVKRGQTAIGKEAAIPIIIGMLTPLFGRICLSRASKSLPLTSYERSTHLIDSVKLLTCLEQVVQRSLDVSHPVWGLHLLNISL